jgi:outer membrane protein insertion porin family
MSIALTFFCTDANGQGGGAPAGPAGGPAGPDEGPSFRSRLLAEGGPSYRAAGDKLVTSVRIVGNEMVAENEIRTHLRTRENLSFDPEVVEADVRRLVSSGRVRHVRTFTDETPQGVVVTFQVSELPTIRYIKFLGNRSYMDRTLLKFTGLKAGEPMNRFSVVEGRKRIAEYYLARGYGTIEVSVFEGDRPQDRGIVYVIDEGVRQRISDVEFSGNQFVSGARLKALIQSKPALLKTFRGIVDREKIDQDVERLTSYYRNFGYFQTRIGRELVFDENNKWLTLKFVIDEGARYSVRSVSVAGNGKFTTPSLMGQLELKSGDFFDLRKMNRDVNSLQDAYGIQGHIFADIQAEPRFFEEPGWIDLVYNVEEGQAFRVGQINVKIAGESPHTKRSVVLNRMSVRPLDLCNIQEIRKSERRLISSQLFEHNPSSGITPKIVIQPPDLTEIERMSSLPQSRRPSRPQVRGQNPY